MDDETYAEEQWRNDCSALKTELAEIELELVRSRLACNIGTKKNRTSFLLSVMQRLEAQIGKTLEAYGRVT